MLGIPLGLLYVNAGEWLIHRHVLHGKGVKKGTYYELHWKRHHQRARKQGGYDEDFDGPIWSSRQQRYEVAGLTIAALVHLPLFPIAPFFTGAVLYSLASYHLRHKRAHVDPEWAKAHLPWHYDHHMGPDQQKNWCVSRPWFDWLMRTRAPYHGTERERLDLERRAMRAQRTAA